MAGTKADQKKRGSKRGKEAVGVHRRGKYSEDRGQGSTVGYTQYTDTHARTKRGVGGNAGVAEQRQGSKRKERKQTKAEGREKHRSKKNEETLFCELNPSCATPQRAVLYSHHTLLLPQDALPWSQTHTHSPERKESNCPPHIQMTRKSAVYSAHLQWGRVCSCEWVR